MEQRYRKTPNGTYVYEKIELPTVGRLVVIDDETLMGLPEYSLTNPTGAFENKTWRRNTGYRGGLPGWVVCEYVAHPTNADLLRVSVRTPVPPAALAAVAEGVLWWIPS